MGSLKADVPKPDKVLVLTGSHTGLDRLVQASITMTRVGGAGEVESELTAVKPSVLACGFHNTAGKPPNV